MEERRARVHIAYNAKDISVGFLHKIREYIDKKCSVLTEVTSSKDVISLPKDQVENIIHDLEAFILVLPHGKWSIHRNDMNAFVNLQLQFAINYDVPIYIAFETATGGMELYDFYTFNGEIKALDGTYDSFVEYMDALNDLSKVSNKKEYVAPTLQVSDEDNLLLLLIN